MKKFGMNKWSLAAMSVSLILLVFIGIGSAQCGRGNREGATVITVDSVRSDAPHSHKKPSSKKPRRKKAIDKSSVKKGKHNLKKPAERRHLDDRVN